MKRARFSHKLPHNAVAGFSLTELMVTLLVSSILMTAMAGFFRAATGARRNVGGETEAQQGIRTLLSILTQELRQAGACLPKVGQFVALAGVNNGTTDSLTMRMGKVNQTTLLCIQPLTTAAVTGGSTLQLTSTSGLIVDDLLYILPAGGTGIYRKIQSISGNNITFTVALPSVSYPVNTTVYAIDERTYTIDNSNPSRPKLTVTIDQGAPQPLIDGAEYFDVRYLVAPCNPNCGGPNASPPTTNANWRLVREVEIKAIVNSYKKNQQGVTVKAATGTTGQEGEYVSIKPRNLL